jgi:hypothetical protein
MTTVLDTYRENVNRMHQLLSVTTDCEGREMIANVNRCWDVLCNDHRASASNEVADSQQEFLPQIYGAVRHT